MIPLTLCKGNFRCIQLTKSANRNKNPYKDMGIVWETHHKRVPLLGVPQNLWKQLRSSSALSPPSGDYGLMLSAMLVQAELIKESQWTLPCLDLLTRRWFELSVKKGTSPKHGSWHGWVSSFFLPQNSSLDGWITSSWKLLVGKNQSELMVRKVFWKGYQ